jgi:hypothetical protein
VVALDAVELDARVPHRRVVAADHHLEQRLDDLEQAGQHLGRGEVLLDLLLAEGVALLLQLLADVAPVPGLRVGMPSFRRERAHVRPRPSRRTGGPARQVAQELDHLVGRLGHLGHHRHLGEVAVAEQLRFFLRSDRISRISAVLSNFGSPWSLARVT